MTEGERRAFFVSFNQGDRHWATWIAWMLERAGYSVLFQDWDFRGSFIEEMHRATMRTERTLVVLSDNYLRSEFARSEAWAALAGDPMGRKDRVVTIRVGPTGELGLLAHFAYLDLTAEAEANAERLLLERARMSLESCYRPKPADRPPFPGARPDFPAPAPGPKAAVNNLPPANPDFVGREDMLAELRRSIVASQGAAVLPLAITGLGGIGKSQTARAYAYRHLVDYELIWWLRADTPATLAVDFATLAEPLGLDPDMADQTRLAAAVRQRLQSRSGWLLILDNVNDPTLPRHWLPGTGGGHALITSRRTDWHGLAKAVGLELMAESEALQLLTVRPDPQVLPLAELAAARDLAAELGHLPLALAQARAYMAESGKSVAAYLRMFRASGPGNSVAAPGLDYPASYAATWRLSIDAAQATCPGARPLLELLAFLAADPLPVEVLGAAPKAVPEVLRAEHARDEAVAALRRYSLLRVEGGSITVHRLVQAVTRDGLRDDAAYLARSALTLARAGLPRRSWEPPNWRAVATLLPHILKATSHAERLRTSPMACASALCAVALYHESHAAWELAEPLFRHVLKIGEENLDPNDIRLAYWLNNLGQCLKGMERFREAEPLFRRSLDILSDKTDLWTLSTVVANLGGLYRKTHRYQQAEQLLHQAIAIDESELPPDHKRLASRYNNLAQLYRKMKRIEKAERFFQRAIAIGGEALGPEHPRLATWLNNLALLYRDDRRHGDAERFFGRAIAVGERTLGPEHPDLAVWIGNLADLYRTTDRHAEAAPLYQRAIATLEASLPPTHPQIVTARANYTALLEELGRSAEASSRTD